jgi:ankyrin repeat protein
LDAGLEDDAQQTPLDMAAAYGNLEVLKIFEKNM